MPISKWYVLPISILVYEAHSLWNICHARSATTARPQKVDQAGSKNQKFVRRFIKWVSMAEQHTEIYQEIHKMGFHGKAAHKPMHNASAESCFSIWQSDRWIWLWQVPGEPTRMFSKKHFRLLEFYSFSFLVIAWGGSFPVPAFLFCCAQSEVRKDVVWVVRYKETLVSCTEPWPQSRYRLELHWFLQTKSYAKPSCKEGDNVCVLVRKPTYFWPNGGVTKKMYNKSRVLWVMANCSLIRNWHNSLFGGIVFRIVLMTLIWKWRVSKSSVLINCFTGGKGRYFGDWDWKAWDGEGRVGEGGSDCHWLWNQPYSRWVWGAKDHF